MLENIAVESNRKQKVRRESEYERARQETGADAKGNRQSDAHIGGSVFHAHLHWMPSLQIRLPQNLQAFPALQVSVNMCSRQVCTQGSKSVHIHVCV